MDPVFFYFSQKRLKNVKKIERYIDIQRKYYKVLASFYSTIEVNQNVTNGYKKKLKNKQLPNMCTDSS